MPQGPIGTAVAKTPSNVLSPLSVDAEGTLLSSAGGLSSKLNLTAASVIKAAPGRIAKLIIVSGGTASDGAFTLNDCATIGAATAANEIISIAAGETAGTIIDLQWPCEVGIVLSAVPSAGSPILAMSFS
jgi:hypothetical protein